MKKYLPLLLLLLVCGATVWQVRQTTQAAQQAAPSEAARNQREALYRDNNLGVALMEQFKHEEAAKAFRKALASDAKFALARINLSLALFFLNDSPGALKEAQEAVKLAPTNLTAQYALGLALRSEKQYDEAVAAFNKVLATDSQDAGANVQVGQLYAQKQQYEPAIKAFRAALAAESYNQTAAYSLAQALIRSGKTADGQQMLAVFQKLKASGYATSFGNVYGEKGRYGEGVVSTGAESELVAKDAPQVKFTDATAEMGLNATFANKPLSNVLSRKVSKTEFGDEAFKRELVNPFSATIALPDFDADGKLDVFAAGLDASGKPFVKLWRNVGGKFTDVTDKSKLTASTPISGAVFGDFNNDNTQDALLFGYNTLALWANNGDGTFSEVTAATGLPANYASWALTAAFVDADHDGDLDVFVGNFADLTQWPGSAETAVFPDEFAGTPNRFFRNNGAKEGKWSFTDTTEATGLSGGALKTTAVVCTDYDNRRDIDFFVVNYGAPAQLLANQRDGSFKLVSIPSPLPAGPALGVGAGDLNKDGFTDFYLVRHSSAMWHVSNGRGGFQQASMADAGISGVLRENRTIQMADLDNDGTLDVVELGKDWLRIRNYRPTPNGSAWETSLLERLETDTRAFALGDLNGDGALEALSFKSNGALTVLKFSGVGKNFAAINLAGKTSNRSGIGAKAEMRSGSLSQKLESYASSPAPAPASMIFGLGFRTQVDTLNLIWPAGIVQSELAVKANAAQTIEELDRKGTSCPLLYAWNGREYQFITDFLGGSAIGYRVGGGKNDWNYPDTDEYVLVTGEQLQAKDAKDGRRYSLRMNNQLEEVIYFDAVKLLAIDHPAATRIYPNERLLPARPYPAFKIYATRNAAPPLSARDETGRDLLPAVSKLDRIYPDNFALLPFKGYASEHALTLDLGQQAKDAKRVLLLLSAWIDYADSTSNLAASQAGVKLVPPYLQTRNAKGEWVTTIAQMGFPAGLTKTMTVELPKDALCHSTEVRLVTSMRIYWDQILVDVSNGPSPTKVTTLPAVTADLRWRGFPREFAADDKGLKAYDYRMIEAIAPWKAHLGNYTRYGDVRELLLGIDDMYVITRNGDELQLDFDATKLPALPAGWRRDFLVFADGFGKDMDLHSARPDTIGELPYHGMKSYPYAAGDAYPNDVRRQAYLRKYNTRTVRDQRAAHWQGTR